MLLRIGFVVVVGPMGVVAPRDLDFVARTSLDDFVEFSTVEPDAAALRAVVDFDSLAFRDHEGYAASWTVHGFLQ